MKLLLVADDGEAARAHRTGGLTVALHFVGFRGDDDGRAVRVFGEPDFIHIGWDTWARLDIKSGDVAVFSRGTFEDPPSPYSFPDIRE